MGFIYKQEEMARSGYISVNLTPKQLEFAKLLDDFELDIFTIEEIQNTFKIKFENINEIIENLVHKKILVRIERGKFCKVNFRDELVIANILIPDAAIAYWSALNIHSLTEQITNTIFVQTKKSKKKKKIFGVEYRFIRVTASKQIGIIKQGVGNHQYRITDREKTIVDCFDLPKYSGGFDNLIKAFYNSDWKQDKLIEYCRAIHNIAAIKRMGIVAELTHKKDFIPFIDFAIKQVNSKYNLMDPFGSERGTFNNKWKVRMNLTEEEILKIANKQY